jgi:hypothetical protein
MTTQNICADADTLATVLRRVGPVDNDAGPKLEKMLAWTNDRLTAAAEELRWRGRLPTYTIDHRGSVPTIGAIALSSGGTAETELPVED